ncbi:hypothetical protein [Amycolatopsis sp. 3B14]|uniref:hypothetical protein n=1 Tax=Amycolatopsis sp. 3B14 TaxID=3243600 RepID=UPI003D97A6EE
MAAYGQESADLIRRRLGQLQAVANLAKLREFAALRLRAGANEEGAVMFISAGPAIELVVRSADGSVDLSDEAAINAVVVVDLVPAEPVRSGRRSEASSLEYKGSLS